MYSHIRVGKEGVRHQVAPVVMIKNTPIAQTYLEAYSGVQNDWAHGRLIWLINSILLVNYSVPCLHAFPHHSKHT